MTDPRVKMAVFDLIIATDQPLFQSDIIANLPAGLPVDDALAFVDTLVAQGSLAEQQAASGDTYYSPTREFLRGLTAQRRKALEESLAALPQDERLARLRHDPNFMLEALEEQALAQHNKPSSRTHLRRAMEAQGIEGRLTKDVEKAFLASRQARHNHKH